MSYVVSNIFNSYEKLVFWLWCATFYRFCSGFVVKESRVRKVSFLQNTIIKIGLFLEPSIISVAVITQVIFGFWTRVTAQTLIARPQLKPTTSLKCLCPMDMFLAKLISCSLGTFFNLNKRRKRNRGALSNGKWNGMLPIVINFSQ